MTEQEIKLKVIEERVKKLEDRVDELALRQYEPEYDISDPEPYVPVAACSQETQFEAMRKHDEWVKRQQSNYVNQV